MKNKNITLSQINFDKTSKNFIGDHAISTSHMEYENQNLSIEILNNEHNDFWVDTLLKHQTITNDPLSFLFQNDASIAITAYPLSNHHRRSLPLLNQHFDAQRTMVVSTESESIIYETEPVYVDKSQGNILQDLGIFSE